MVRIHYASCSFQWMRLRFDPEPDVCLTAAFAGQVVVAAWSAVLSPIRGPSRGRRVEARVRKKSDQRDVSGRVRVGEVSSAMSSAPGVGVWFRSMQEEGILGFALRKLV